MAEKEYIERDSAVFALEKALYSYEEETEAKFKDDPELDLAEWFFHRIFVQVMNGHDRQAILDLPAADVRHVVRGEWKVFDPDFNSYSCSACGEPFTLNDGTPRENNMNFCPNCGADMREES